jgi:hypothetical protein
MKKLYLLIAMSFFVNGYSQFNQNAPWMGPLESRSKKELTFDEIQASFNNYWKNKDFSKKGSGFKPFKRWENHWENSLNQDGTMVTAQQLWSAWDQKNQSKKAKSTFGLPVSNWTAIGPFTHTNTGSWSSGQGRVNTVCVDPSNPNTIYIGSPAGGIWKSADAGLTWIPLSDNLPQIGVSGIAVDYTNSNIIYIATGDRDSQDTYSVGVLKSTDGGLTWNTTGLSIADTNSYIGDIVIDPTNSQVLLCATSFGLQRTTDGGLSWNLKMPGNFSQGNIRFNPSNSQLVYAVSEDAFYRSSNNGDTFENIALPTINALGRINLDVTLADSNYVYLLAVNQDAAFEGIYRSTDMGLTWSKMSTATTPAIFDGSGQAYYDLAFAVSQTDKNTIYTGCLNIWKSPDGGATFTKVNNWNQPTAPAYTHADIHYLKAYGNKLYANTDGGIYVSDNNTASFKDLTAGLQISQFYKVAVSKQSAGKMVGGLQDNGGHAYSNNLWKNYYGADGMDTAIDPLNSDKFYGFIQFGGSLNISNNAGDSRASGVSAPTAEVGTNDQGGNWITPLAMNSQGELFAGYSKLYRLSNGAWTAQSISVIGASTNNIELVTVDPSNDNIMYVVNGTKLYKSTDKGINFTNTYTASSNISSICVHSSDSSIIYITTASVNGEVLKSTDGGTLFTAFSTGLPSLSKRVVRHQGRNSLNPLYLGTTLGVYYRDDSMSQWEPFDTNLPNVEVTDLEINLEDSILTAATYGRGIWQTPIPTEVPANDLKFVSIEKPVLNIPCQGTILPQIKVKNNGSNTINSVAISYNYNSTPLNYTWTGTILSSAIALIDLPSFTVSSGVYSLIVNSTITNDAYADNNKGNGIFYVNASGNANVLNSFENTTDNLLTFNDGSITSQWQRGIRSGGSVLDTGTNNVYTTNFTGNYSDNLKSYLISPCYNLTNAINPQIKFKLAFDLEQDYDIVYVEYSTDMGQNWNVLGEKGPNWYNSDRTPQTSGQDCENCLGAQWTGSDTVLRDYFYPLTSLVGQSNVIFRIVFQSDPAENKLGVVVDDFVIEGTLGNEEFELKNIAIFPNPSMGLFNISAGETPIEQIDVIDVSGKKVISFSNFATSNSVSTIDLRALASGLYFVKISANNQKTVKRIIKN